MHDAILADLPAYAAGTLGPADRLRVDAHLAACAVCRLELAQWQALATAARRQVAERTVRVPAWVSPLAGRPVPADGPRRVRRRLPLVLLLLVLGLVAGRLALRDRAPSGNSGADASIASTNPPRPTRVVIAMVSGRAATKAAGIQSAAAVTVARAVLDPLSPTSAADRALAPGVTESPAKSGRPMTGSTDPAADAGAGLPLPGDPPTTPDPPGEGPQDPPNEEPKQQPRETRDPPAGSVPDDSPTPFALPTDVPPPISPTAAPPSQGVMSGRVHGPDGQPRAEIDVYADPLDPAQGGRKASTGSDGGYRLDLPPGRWLLHAETAAYQLMWYGGSPNPLLAEPLEIAAGQTRRADFYLEPSPPGLIRGQVVDEEGRPLARALVVVAYPPDGEDAGPRLVWSVFSGADGSFSLSLPPGAWHLAAAADWRQPHLAWWGGAGAWEQSDALAVSASAPVDGVRLTVDP